MLCGGLPSLVAPEYDAELGMAHGVTPEPLAEALAARRTRRAPPSSSRRPTTAWPPTSPACAEVAHAAGVPLVVDQSWGPHFGFHPDLPASALALGADAVLTSTHKIVGSLTQSAMLHVAPTGRIDPGRGRARRPPRRARRRRRSLLMASLDAARRQLAVHGEALLHARSPPRPARARELAAHPRHRVDRRRLRRAARRRRAGTRCASCSTCARPAAPATRSPTPLRNAYDVQPELATHATIVFVLGIGQPAEALERFAGDVDETVKRISGPGARPRSCARPPRWSNEIVVAPREAFLGDAEASPSTTRSAASRASRSPATRPASRRCCPASGSPREVVAYLRELVAAGARLHGASDPTFRTICVLAGLTLPVRRPAPAVHGVAMDGSYWRFTWPRRARRRRALRRPLSPAGSLGAGRARRGLAPAWRSRILDSVVHARETSIRSGAAWASEPERLRVDLGPTTARVEGQLYDVRRWPRAVGRDRAGGLGLPGLGQYWHPHVLAGAAPEGIVAVGSEALGH